jgi:uncharacterized membrane protein SirB2
MYSAFKHLHVACVILSIGGFSLRGFLMLRDSPRLRNRWFQILPHVNDTVLLLAAGGLVVVSEQYPFVTAWVTAKIFGLLAYIILGSVALKAGRTKRIRALAGLAAMGVFAYVVSVALSKSPWGFLAAT